MKFIVIFPLVVIFIFCPFKQLKAQNVGVNTTTPQAALDVNGDIILRPAELSVADGITLALDVNTSRFSYYRVAGPAADFTIAGIAAGIDGRLITFFNRSGFAMQLNNEDANAAATDMIITGTGLNVAIPNKGVVTLQYDGIEEKWIVKSSNKGGTGNGGYWDLNGNDIFNNTVGNVGIGTSNPIDKLTLQTPLNSNGFTHIGGANEVILNEFIGGVSAGIGTSTNHAFRLNAGGTGRVSIYPAGEVVVGSNSTGAYANAKLTVETTDNSYGMIQLSNTGNAIGSFIGGTSAGFGTYSNTAMRIFSNNVSSMFIATNGNVGVGSLNDPQYQLDIGNRMRIRSGSGGSTAGVWLNNPTNTAPIAFMGIADNFTAGIYGNVSGWGLIMNVNTGNVGIGTLNPTNKLSVNGDIRSKEVVVESTGWPDYVFDKKYTLNPLDEVEKFIAQNKHLPNMPSAKEVEEKGLHLGDVQKRMMEKIEELTLYVIELKKEIEILKTRQ